MSKYHFDKSGAKIYLRLIKSIKPYWFAFAVGIFATIASTGIDAFIAWAVKPIIDKGFVAKDAHFLEWIPVAIIVAFLIRGATRFLSNYCINRVGRSVVMDFRKLTFAQLLKLPASFYDKEPSGNILSLIIYNINQLASATTDALLTIVQQTFTVVGSIVVMLIISWQLTLFFLIVTPIVVLITNYMNKRQRKLSIGVQQSVADVTHIAREGIDGYKVVRTFGGENYERKKFDKAAEVNRNRELKVVVTNALGSSSVQVICALPMALIMYLFSIHMLHISVGGFGAMIVAVLRLLTPIRRLTKVTTTVQKGVAGAESVYDLLDTEVENDSGTKSLAEVKGKIEYRHVNFSYQETQKPVLPDISFKVKPGQVVALVGHSGGGKSTIVNLLPRFYDVLSGEILLDGVNICDYKLADLRKQIAFVSQHITLFNDTIANNIAYGKFDSATEDDILKAAKAAHFLNVINHLPDGLHTQVGEHGLMLSGGQRQRLAIARAILKDAPILILDEATSALDTKSERYVQSSLEKLMQGRTTLVIAHRLSTVEKADNIIVLDEGRIVEQGTHKDLIQRDGYYAQLYKMQFSE